MARTINDIQQSILDKKSELTELSALEVLTNNEKASLSNLTSTSKVAVWRLFIYIIAVAIWVLESLFDIFKAEIEAKVKDNRPHTADWYKTKALAFQYGDALIDDDEYAVIDTAKQIVKQVAIVEGDRKLVIKVATLQGNELVKLPDINQVNAFSSYMDKVKDAGTLMEIINEDADKLKIVMDFHYNALLLKNDGTTIDTNVNVVQKAINDYLQSIDFNGEFEINRMVDYLQRATGYQSLKLNFVGFKAGLATGFSPIDRIYKPLSGYMKVEELEVTYYASL
jgi:hypothetical protein